MRRVVSVVLALAFVAGLGFAVRGDDAPKHTTKEVMGKAMKGKNSLTNKVAGGKATDEEKKLLVELFTAMAANKPPKGDEESWKKLTGDLLTAAKDAAEGKEGAGANLKKAANCGACHEKHKGS